MDIGIASAEATAKRGTRGAKHVWKKPRTRQRWKECTLLQPYMSRSEMWKTDGRQGAVLAHRNTYEVVVQNEHVCKCHNASFSCLIVHGITFASKHGLSDQRGTMAWC